MTKGAVKKTASQRQTEFVTRKREAGYVQLSGIFVPAAGRTELRAEIKKLIADWEERNKV